MTWSEFYYAMLRGFTDLGLKSANIFELGSLKKRLYSRKMIIASAYIRMIKEYNPDEVDGDNEPVHVLTSEEMFNVMRNLNGLFETQYFYNFNNDY
jgi:hypothetical protein